jgi:hypothetical protein
LWQKIKDEKNDKLEMMETELWNSWVYLPSASPPPPSPPQLSHADGSDRTCLFEHIGHSDEAWAVLASMHNGEWAKPDDHSKDALQAIFFLKARQQTLSHPLLAPPHAMTMIDDDPAVIESDEEVVVAAKDDASKMFNWDSIRDECDELTALESIDKEAALRIHKMYHNMETLVHGMRVEHTRKMDELRTRFLEFRLRHEQSAMQ